MKWHDDNREKLEEHCLLAAVSENFQVDEKRLEPLIESGYVERLTVYVVTPLGEKRYDEVAAEIDAAVKEGTGNETTHVPR